MRKTAFIFLIVLGLAAPASASLNVVATLPWIGSLAKAIGGDQLIVTALIKPNQDPHMVEAKPSMILAGRRADIIMYNGLDLEIGYLPLILESARNPKILPGKPGNVDCSRFVQVIEKPATVDRSLGDVHPLGNPHYHFSPFNVYRVAAGITDALAQLDGIHAAYYRENFKKFSVKFNEKKKEWAKVELGGKKFVAYHQLFEYLTPAFGIDFVGYLEPKPGIPPSAGHIEGLIESMNVNEPDGILTTSYYGKKESESLGEKTGVKVILLPGDVGSRKGTQDWFAFMDTVLTALR